MSLSKEIINRIFIDLGVSPKEFGSHGITQPDFQCPQKLILSYEDGTQLQYMMWSAETILKNDKIQVLLVDLSEYSEKEFEYILAFLVLGKPIYLLRSSSREGDSGTFLIKESDVWQSPNLIVQAQAMIGIETITMHGVTWNPSPLNQTLYQAVSYLAELS